MAVQSVEGYSTCLPGTLQMMILFFNCSDQNDMRMCLVGRVVREQRSGWCGERIWEMEC